MTRKHRRPLDIPTLMLAIGPLLIVAALTAIGMRASLARRALIDAASKGDVKQLTQLLNHGADVNDVDVNGWTALGHAANARQYEAAKLLIERGANVNATGHGYIRTPLALACAQPFAYQPANRRNTRIIQLLLDHGADVKLDHDSDNSPIALLMQDNDTEDARLLIERGADIDVLVDGYPLLFYAVQSNNTTMLQLLLDRGAAADFREPKTGETPLIHAVMNGRGDMVKLLLAHGVRTNVRDKMGLTALQWAYKNHPTLVPWLRHAGATK